MIALLDNCQIFVRWLIKIFWQGYSQHCLDVVSRGEYIEKNSNLVVIEVTGNQIIVRER